jgi:hypothetical protein
MYNNEHITIINPLKAWRPEFERVVHHLPLLTDNTNIPDRTIQNFSIGSRLAALRFYYTLNIE